MFSSAARYADSGSIFNHQPIERDLHDLTDSLWLDPTFDDLEVVGAADVPAHEDETLRD